VDLSFFTPEGRGLTLNCSKASSILTCKAFGNLPNDFSADGLMMISCNYSAFFRKVIDYTVISTAGRNLERWCMNSDLRFLATLGMTKDAE
jgi:hypothetical protein